MNQNRAQYVCLNARIWILGALLALPIIGCGSGGEGTAKYMPSADTSRQALEAALQAWKRGEPPGKITGTGAAIEVADSKRLAGQSLAGYEILGEVPGEGPKRFSVRLKLENPTQQRETQYIVVGIDPIWVFAAEDYGQEKGM